MVSRHKLISKVNREIIKEYNSISKKGLNSLEEENVIKLSDPTPHSKSMIEYDPDFIIRRNLTQNTYYYIVFEIISKQSDIKTMADVSRILASREIRRAIFLSTSASKKEETDRIVNTLMGLYRNRFKKTKRDDIIRIWSLEVLKTDEEEDIKNLILDNIKDLLPKNKN